MNSSTKEILEIMASNEEKIMNLYNLFAKRFPARKDFWRTVAMQEKNHRDLLLNLVKERAFSVADDRFDKNAFLEINSYVDSLIEEAKGSKVNEGLCVKASADIEYDLEIKFLPPRKSDPALLYNVLERLAIESKEHYLKILGLE